MRTLVGLLLLVALNLSNGASSTREAENTDFTPFSTRVIEEGSTPNRPSTIDQHYSTTDKEPHPTENPLTTKGTPTFPCGDEFEVNESGAKRGYFSTPNYPFSYPSNMNCVWKIKGPNGYFVKIQFRSIDTEPKYDLLKVYPGLPTCEQINATNMKPVASHSGHMKSSVVIVGTNQAIVNFNSDQYVTASGFLATFELIPDNEELMMVGNSGTGMSPGYPGHFIPQYHMTNIDEPNFATYTWHITTGFSSVLPTRMFDSLSKYYSGVVVSFSSMELPQGAKLTLKDMGQNCENGSLVLTNSSVNYEAYSDCNQVTLTLQVPDGKPSKLKFNYNAICNTFYCSYDQYLLQSSYNRVIIGGLIFLTILVMALSWCVCITCCCCSSQTNSNGQRVVIRRRVCGPSAAFPNPGYDEERPKVESEAGELPVKTPLSQSQSE